MLDRPIVILSCRVFEQLFSRYLPPELAPRVHYFEYGLHSRPKDLRATIQSAIDEIDTPHLVVLGYGMCGNGLKGIHSGIHTLLMPRTEDCIAIFLGSNAAYRAQFSACPGTYYLTGGWLQAGSNPLQEYEKMVLKYGRAAADHVMDIQYHNYKRLALVGHSPADLDEYRGRARAVAAYCERWNMKYEEILGSPAYIQRLVQTALDLSQADDTFRVVPPGSEIA